MGHMSWIIFQPLEFLCVRNAVHPWCHEVQNCRTWYGRLFKRFWREGHLDAAKSLQHTSGLRVNWRLRNEYRNSIPMMCQFQVVLLIGLAAKKSCVNQSKAQHKSRCRVMSLVWNFLHLFLWSHFVGKPVLTLQIVSCFVRLHTGQNCCSVA